MAGSDRGADELRRQIAAEREQLAAGVSDLRTDLRATARKIPVVVGASLAAGVGLAALRAVLRRR